MAIGSELFDRVEQIQGSDNVVHLCEHRAFPINH